MAPDTMTEALATAGDVAPRDDAPLPDATDPIMVGGLLTPVPGRTDMMEISVPAGSYVLPADIVSALGEGNTLSGVKILDELFGPAQFEETDDKPPVPIIAAGGEFVVTPQQVAALAAGNLDRGHGLLDDFVKEIRADLVKTLKKLPGPAR